MKEQTMESYGAPLSSFIRHRDVYVPRRFRGNQSIQMIGPFQQGGFFMDVRGVSNESIVYSLGAGDNIEWDLALIRIFGCRVFAYDPDPLAVGWLGKQQLPERFIFTAVGVSDHDGTMTFYQPYRPDKINKSSILKTSKSTTLPVKRLPTLMAENGHNRIDVLKVNIEGGEFAVISDIAALPIKQVIIEFHGRFVPWTGWLKTVWADVRLRLAGFRLAAREGDIRTYVKWRG
jgi:FkbM family methyltransferase